jgi:hypothetical protein
LAFGKGRNQNKREAAIRGIAAAIKIFVDLAAQINGIVLSTRKVETD